MLIVVLMCVHDLCDYVSSTVDFYHYHINLLSLCFRCARGKTNSIQASHVLTHRTTGWTRRSLTSGIGRDRVQFT